MRKEGGGRESGPNSRHSVWEGSEKSFPFFPYFPGARRATDAAIPQVSLALSRESIQAPQS